VSAVSYHFGSRQGLLLEVLARRGGPVDARRGELRSALGDRPALDDLVSCLVVPYAALLASEGGRSYLRIVVQLRGRFAAWRVESDEATTVHLSGILDELEARPQASLAVRRERIVALIMLMTGATAERARHLDEGATSELTDEQFVANLVTMCSAVLAA
jgi:AcrR family transcriptional regulator